MAAAAAETHPVQFSGQKKNGNEARRGQVLGRPAGQSEHLKKFLRKMFIGHAA